MDSPGGIHPSGLHEGLIRLRTFSKIKIQQIQQLKTTEHGNRY